MLAQMFASRVVGLRGGTIVYDGPPDGLTPEVLTRIYGEEDWSATIQKSAQAEDEAIEEPPARAVEPELAATDRNRMAGLT
jgi:phosphonate transport system ATP-binding protein